VLASHTLRRVFAAAALIAAVAVVGGVLLGSRGGSYSVHARFQNASQLVKGNLVQVAGVPVGKIQSIDLTPDGQADVRMKITDAGYRPLRRGTRAIIRQASLSGVANRYVDLQLPAADHQQTIPAGGVIDQSDTTTAVDLDQLFNTFDPKTRKALSGVIRGYAASYAGKGEEAFAEWRTAVREVAACPNVYVKVGGLGMKLTGFTFFENDMPPSSEDLEKAWRPYVETCITAFGPQRSMFESNFPVDKGMCSYPVMWNAFKRIAAGCSADEKTALFSGAAAKAYRLEV